MDDFNFVWFFGLLMLATILFGLSWLCFQRRDIRVIGEGILN